MEEPRTWTPDEAADLLLRQVQATAEYWASLPNKTPRERCDGVAFSVLTILDGESLSLPAFTLTPNPHPDDKDYLRGEGENWFEAEPLPGALHERFHR